MMTPEQERIDAASHAPPCTAIVDGFPCDRNLGHHGDHATGEEVPPEIAEQMWQDAVEAFHGVGPYALENQD